MVYLGFTEYSIAESPEVTCVEVTPPVSKKSEPKISKKRKYKEEDEAVPEKKLTGREVIIAFFFAEFNYFYILCSSSTVLSSSLIALFGDKFSFCLDFQKRKLYRQNKVKKIGQHFYETANVKNRSYRKN